jgi:hypothetical protein
LRHLRTPLCLVRTAFTKSGTGRKSPQLVELRRI